MGHKKVYSVRFFSSFLEVSILFSKKAVQVFAHLHISYDIALFNVCHFYNIVLICVSLIISEA